MPPYFYNFILLAFQLTIDCPRIVELNLNFECTLNLKNLQGLNSQTSSNLFVSYGDEMPNNVFNTNTYPYKISYTYNTTGYFKLNVTEINHSIYLNPLIFGMFLYKNI